MRPHLRPIHVFTLRLSVLCALLLGLAPLTASAAPPVGFREDWSGTSLQDWGGGSLYDNPGTGGTGGAGDGYLLVYTPSPYHLGTVNLGPPYQGNWLAAGLQVVKVSLNDVGNAEPLSIHFSIANQFSIWQYSPAFVPPHNQWAEFTVDLTSPSSWSRLIGSASYLETLANVDRVHFRHDVSPYIHVPDAIKADFGIDRLIVTTFATPVQTTTWGRIKRLYHDGN
jgi:hypothetical protein